MPAVQIITPISDVTDRGDNSAWTFASVMRGRNGQLITDTPRPVAPEGGLLKVSLVPGYAEARHGKRVYRFLVPEVLPEGHTLANLLEDAIAFPAETPQELLDVAVGKYVETNRAQFRTRAVPITSGEHAGMYQWLDEHGTPTGDPVEITEIITEAVAAAAAAAAAPAALTAEAESREVTVTDLGGGQGRIEFGEAQGPAFTWPANGWSGITGRPTVLDGTSTAAEVRAAIGAAGRLIATSPAFAGGMGTSKTAAENTAAFDAVMAAASAGPIRDVFIPAGTYTVFECTKPANVNLYGEMQREATAIPSSGTVLYRADRAGDGWVLWAEKGIVSGLALRGAGQLSGVDPAHHGLFASADCRIENVLITRCLDGVNGNGRSSRRGSGQYINVVMQNNLRYGITGIRDATLIQCQANANKSHGAYFAAGDNDSQWIGGRIDWNDGAGISFYQSADNRISDVVIDRNGAQGVFSSQSTNNRVDSLFTRNGRLAAGNDPNDTHLTTTNDTNCVYMMNTAAGYNDDGVSGYLSPKFSVRHAGGTEVQVIASSLGGCTSTTPAVKVSDGDVHIYSNRGLNSQVQTMERHRARWASVAPVIIAASSSGVLTLPMPTITGTNTEAVDLTLTLKARGSTGGRYSAELPLAYFRNASDALVSLGAISNRVGTRFALSGGTFLNVAVTVDAAGTQLTLTVTNADAATTYHVAASLAIS